jgi:hypothetical protein
MVYGILLESIVQFIREKYDRIVFKQIQEYDLCHLNLFGIYEDRLMTGTAEGLISFSAN